MRSLSPLSRQDQLEVLADFKDDLPADSFIPNNSVIIRMVKSLDESSVAFFIRDMITFSCYITHLVWMRFPEDEGVTRTRYSASFLLLKLPKDGKTVQEYCIRFLEVFNQAARRILDEQEPFRCIHKDDATILLESVYSSMWDLDCELVFPQLVPSYVREGFVVVACEVFGSDLMLDRSTKAG